MSQIEPKIDTTHDVSSANSDIESLRSLEYMGNYYLKDYEYLSPKVLERGRGAGNIVASLERNKAGNCKLFARLWLREVMKGLKQFLYEGSLHGVKYIFEPTFSFKERMIWVVILVISIAICAVNIFQLFSKWHSTPFVNVIDSLPTPIWAVPFPMVVVCPQLHLQRSFVNVSEIDKQSLNHFFASLVCPQMSRTKQAPQKRMTPKDNVQMQKFIVEGSPKCTDIIKSCYWRPTQEFEWLEKECCEKMFKPIFTDYGLCFAFNSLPLNAMNNDTQYWHKTFDKDVTQQPLNWSLDGGYPKVFPPDPTMIPLRVMASGEIHGLGVELYLNSSEHQYECDGNNLGYNVLISSPTDHVYVSTVLRLPMNKMTTIEVSPTTYKTDNALRALAPYIRQCFFQDENKLNYYEFYTDSNCKHDLWIREVKKKCHCVLYNWPRLYIWESICSTKSDFRCIEEVRAKVEEKLTYAYYEDSQEDRKAQTEFASCYPACNDILYSSQVFYSDLISVPRISKSDFRFKQ
ncbi:Sodium channel protein Nach [Papilio machaon]|uniref:Sodium channel protein Nach n=1 Tax=Papilio machaon TaxID=76193 RepID=A0A194R870_PAPMA|nr:Sodium channel protein Nach [Papilio machaon]